jgi:hypothetical protein
MELNPRVDRGGRESRDALGGYGDLVDELLPEKGLSMDASESFRGRLRRDWCAPFTDDAREDCRLLGIDIVTGCFAGVRPRSTGFISRYSSMMELLELARDGVPMAPIRQNTHG